MVIGILLITAIPTVTGVAQAVSAQRNRDQQKNDERRMKKFHIDVKCAVADGHAKALDGGRVVLKNDRLWVGPAGICQKGEHGYVAEAFYIEYPDPERAPPPMGLVSQVNDDPPLLNWIYIDKNTMELKYGNKTASIEHNIGPWDWSEDETQVVFDDMEAAFINAFYAVERPLGKWQLFFDLDGNKLQEYVSVGSRRVQIELRRNIVEQEEPEADTKD